MTNENVKNQKRQEHILKALQFLADGGDFSKATGMLQKAKEDRIAAAQIEGHPLNTLYAENAAIMALIEEQILPDLKKWQQDGKNEDLLAALRKEMKQLRTIKYHYKRKENSLYSFLVKYKLIDEDTSSALWGLDDNIRQSVKDACAVLDEKPLPDKYVIEAKIETATRQVLWMVFSEETILLPILAIVSTPEDWYMVKQDELEIGYTLIDYPKGWSPSQDDIDKAHWDRDKNDRLTDEVRLAYSKFLQEFLKIDPTKKKEKVLTGDPSYPVGG